MYLPALRVPTFTANIVSVGDLAQKNNAAFTKGYFYLPPPTAPPAKGKLLGHCIAHNVYFHTDAEGNEIAAPTTQ